MISVGTENVPDIRKTDAQEAVTGLVLRKLAVPEDQASLHHFTGEATEAQRG